MSENATHLLIPFASVSSEAVTTYLQSLNLPHLRQLLDMLTLVDSDIGTEESFSPPHERALARAQGLPVVDGAIPWAAQRARDMGLTNADTLPWCFVTLCHADVGTSSMTLQHPADLPITEAESRQLLQDMSPYFAEDGLSLHYVDAGQWLCCGEPLRGVRTASMDRALSVGLNAELNTELATWQPQGAASASLRRLQNEMQMLLYTHTVNDARNKANIDTINSIWLHGAGDLVDDLAGGGRQVSTNIKPFHEIDVNMPQTLVKPALNEDGPAWLKAWEQLDAGVCADLLKRAQAGEPVKLTLCGERSALTYEWRSKSAWERLKARFRGIFGLKPAYLLSKQL